MTDSDNEPHKNTTPAEILDADWADALSQQTMQAPSATQADGLAQASDDWASALAEQTANQTPHARQPDPAAVFPPIQGNLAEGVGEIDMIMDIPVQLSVELGRTRLTIKNILQLGQGSVVELDGLAGEPMDIYVNGYLIAQGEVVVVEEKYGIRVTDIVTPSDRLSRLNGRR